MIDIQLRDYKKDTFLLLRSKTPDDEGLMGVEITLVLAGLSEAHRITVTLRNHKKLDRLRDEIKARLNGIPPKSVSDLLEIIAAIKRETTLLLP